jgi:alpha-amylase
MLVSYFEFPCGRVDTIIAATSSSTFSPSSAYGPFSSTDDYHPFCFIDDYTNQTDVEQCWLGDTDVALADLNTESQTVVSYWNTWISQLVSNYSIDAIRIDTAKHVRHSFWPDFVAAAGVFNQGEILLNDPEYVGNYQSNGSINPFNYPLYYPLIGAFSGNQSMDNVASVVNQVRGNFSDAGLTGTFVNNHDNPRFESYTSDAAVSLLAGSAETNSVSRMHMRMLWLVMVFLTYTVSLMSPALALADRSIPDGSE